MQVVELTAKADIERLREALVARMADPNQNPYADSDWLPEMFPKIQQMPGVRFFAALLRASLRRYQGMSRTSRSGRSFISSRRSAELKSRAGRGGVVSSSAKRTDRAREGTIVGAGGAGVERGVVDDGAGRSSFWDGATSANAAAGAAASVEGPPAAGPCVGAGAADAGRGVVVDAGGDRSSFWDGATSAKAAAGAAASVRGASRTIVGPLRRDAPPALIFIISAWEAGTAAH